MSFARAFLRNFCSSLLPHRNRAAALTGTRCTRKLNTARSRATQAPWRHVSSRAHFFPIHSCPLPHPITAAPHTGHQEAGFGGTARDTRLFTSVSSEHARIMPFFLSTPHTHQLPHNPTSADKNENGSNEKSAFSPSWDSLAVEEKNRTDEEGLASQTRVRGSSFDALEAKKRRELRPVPRRIRAPRTALSTHRYAVVRRAVRVSTNRATSSLACPSRGPTAALASQLLKRGTRPKGGRLRG